MRLNKNQRCPIHGKFTCCGREEKARKRIGSKWETVRPGVRRIRDEHADHPDGFRYHLSPAAMKKVLAEKIREQEGLCCICWKPFTDCSEIEPDHRSPRGMNGARRDDRPENIGAVHKLCNAEKGSIRNFKSTMKGGLSLQGEEKRMTTIRVEN